MQSTTYNYFQQIASKINQVDLSKFIELFQLALSGSTTQSQSKVYEMLRQIQARPDSYMYFLYIFLNQKYPQNLRHITGTTMKSALERNSKQLHFEESQKNIMKAALLSENITNSDKLKSTQNILVSQLAICFEQIDWQLIYFLIQKVNKSPEVLPLLCTIFEDLKHNSENHSYYEGAVQTQIIQNLLKIVHEFIISILGKIDFSKTSRFPQQIQHLTQSFKIIRTVTFHLPLKLSEYFHAYTNQIVIPVLKALSAIFDKENISSTLSEIKYNFKMLVIQLFQSINQISETKSQYLLLNNQFLDQFVLYFPTSCEHFRKQFQQVCKIWTNIILQLFINDQPNESNQEQQKTDYRRLKMFSYLDMVVPKLVLGFRFTKEDQTNIIHQMQLQHNPYGMEEALNKQQGQSDDEGNFQTKHGKTHKSTLRKISITCIQKICQQYQDCFWGNNKAFMYSLLKDEADFKVQQSAVIFIGIMAQNCIEEIRSDANQILQYLSSIPNRLSHEILLASTLWTFQKLLPAYRESQQCKKFIYQLVYKVMGNKAEYAGLLHSKNLMVKQVAVSLLDELLSQQTDVDLNIIQTMIQCLIYALQSFTGRALFSVFKAITSIFQQSQRPTIEPLMVSQVVKHLCLKWATSVAKDSIMCPLIQCLSYICENRKQYFIEYSLQILQQVYPLFKLTERKSLVLRVIDLTSSIVISAKQYPTSQGYKKIRDIVSSQQFLATVNNLILSQQKQIRHFGYGLLSDITKLNNVPDIKAEFFIQNIAQTMDRSNSTSINNALMCLTDLIDCHPEIGIKYTNQTLQVIADFIHKFPSSNLPKIYLLNFSRMFGRLARLDLSSAKTLSLSGHCLIKQMSQGLRSQQKSQLTLTAFNGLALLLNSLSEAELVPLLQSKQIQFFLDSFMGYRYNLQTNQNMSQILILLNKIKTLLAGRNISWANYLDSTMLYPANINKILKIVN